MDDQQCRLCQSKDVPLIDIFSSSGSQHKISEKINQHLQVFISAGDYLSKSICYKCFGKLDIFNKFVREVHESQANLQKETANKLKGTGPKRLKRETSQGTVDIEADVTSSNFEIGEPQDNDIDTGDNRVSVIKYQYIDSATDPINNQTRLITNSPKSKDLVYRYQHAVNGHLEELNSCENGYGEDVVNRRAIVEKKAPVLKTKSPILRKEAPVKRLDPVLSSDSIQPKQRRKSVHFQQTEKVDFSAQIGNTLYADLVALKNSLLLRRVCVKNSKVLTIPVPVLPNAGNKKTFADTATSKGCQTEILLGAKSESKHSTTVVYQKISFEGRPFLQVGNETNAVIISPLPGSS